MGGRQGEPAAKRALRPDRAAADMSYCFGGPAVSPQVASLDAVALLLVVEDPAHDRPDLDLFGQVGLPGDGR